MSPAGLCGQRRRARATVRPRAPGGTMPPPPCRFHAAGGCAKGSACPFSHDAALLAMPCKFHAAGHCTYGDRCMFDHPTKAAARGVGAPPSLVRRPPAPELADVQLDPAFLDPPSPVAPAWGGEGGGAAYEGWEEEEYDPDAAEVDAALAALELEGGSSPPPAASDSGLCGAYTAAGHCAKGDACRLAHGDLCSTCGRHALHPTDAADRAAHAASCAARAARVAEVTASASVECGVCLEVVLAKARPGERRFGLLEGCDHAFCLACIRGWRSKAGDGALDVGGVRGCPLCRAPSNFVTPSATFPASPDARLAVIAGYKAALGRIECRHWDRGAGACPFGTSCFYSHLDRDGVPVDPATGLRFVGDAEGEVKPMAGMRLSDFLGGTGASAGARRALGRR